MIRAKVVHTWQALSKRQRNELRRLASRARDAGLRCRCKIILALVRGTSPTLIAQGGLCAKSQVYRVAARFLVGGPTGLADRREDNGRPKITPAYQAELLRLVDRSPQEFGYRRPTWTQELLILVLAERVEVAVSAAAMSRLLGRLGIGLRRPKPVVRCPWKEARRRRRLRQIERLVRHLPADEVVLYVDEVDIHLNPKIGRDWMLRGHQRRVITPGNNEKFYLAGALDVRTGRLHTTGTDRKNATLFCQLLWLLASRRYRRAERIHLILDNYGIHKARRTREVLAALGGRIVLHFLPPYCPDANRIERVWQDMHANVTRNHRCKTMVRLLDEARRYLDAYRWRRALERPVARRAA